VGPRAACRRGAAAVVAAVILAVVVVGTSWGGQCASVAEGVTGWDGCSTAPRLGAGSAFVLLLDLVLLVHAVRRVRRTRRR